MRPLKATSAVLCIVHFPDPCLKKFANQRILVNPCYGLSEMVAMEIQYNGIETVVVYQ